MIDKHPLQGRVGRLKTDKHPLRGRMGRLKIDKHPLRGHKGRLMNDKHLLQVCKRDCLRIFFLPYLSAFYPYFIFLILINY